MTNVATLQPEPAPIIACTVSRDVQNFEILIDDMEAELGETWGDLGFQDALVFFDQPDAATLELIAVAVDDEDATDLSSVAAVIRKAISCHIKVILVANQISPIALHQLMRLGADDFVPYPLPKGALRDAIARIRAANAQPIIQSSSPAVSNPQAAASAQGGSDTAPLKATGDRHGVLLPIHGLAGGAGASNFATNLAWELANIDKKAPPRVCLLDLDFQYGSIATYLDLPRKDATFDILTEPGDIDGETFMRALQTYKDKLYVFSAPVDMLPLDIISGEDMGRLLDLALANFDFVIIDMPTTVIAWTEAVLTRAQLYYTMFDLDLRSAQNILRFVRALKAEALPYDKLRYVLNRAPRFTDLAAKSRAKRLAESLDITIEMQLPDGGKQITQSNDHGQPLAEAAAKNPLRKEIHKLAKSLFETNKAAAFGRS